MNERKKGGKDSVPGMDDEWEKFRADAEDDAIQPIDLAPGPKIRAESVAETASPLPEDEANILRKGDYFDLRARHPGLRQLHVAVGWEQRGFDEDKPDVDLSCFLLNKEDQTRVDEDFVFYNASSTCEGAVKHLGDSRTGAGDGDDETIFIDLNSLPFDILKIMFVLSIYDEDRNGRRFDLIRDAFIRLVNHEDGHEIIRRNMEEDEIAGKNAVHALCLVREGPKWYAEAPDGNGEGGLAGVASRYGIIVQEETG